MHLSAPAIVCFAAVVPAIVTAGTTALVYAGWILMPKQEGAHVITTAA